MTTIEGVNAAHETVSASWYMDPDLLEVERKQIFSKTWQLVATVDQFERVGSYFATKVGDVPIVLTRSKSGINAFVNVCRHRFHEVASGSGHARRLTCPYHAWSYDMDGQLCGAPRTENLDSFDKSTIALGKLSTGTWGPMVFVNLDPNPAVTFEDWIKPVSESFTDAGVQVERLAHFKRTTFDINGNWKLIAENYLECYHCQVAHPEYARTFTVDSSEGYPFSFSGHAFSSCTAPKASTNGNATSPYQMEGPVGVNQNDFLWPNFGPTTWPGQNCLLVYTFMPTEVGKTVGHFDYFFEPDCDPEAANGLTEFLDRVGTEDVGLVESVHRGMESGTLDKGLLLPDEGQVEHFQNLWRKALAL
ncbi:aromatic ring-hydroxylating dioxygenase subunit alpha [Dietzia cinnamea]|uniref:Aromatic ring-hydroxylating dioxygenase subunit alpha n=1 Tax=Dietzia cinnamea TaxID=321318 RepID=A0ABV3YCU3_9ACTN|nr:aromatic ring-hydroxylating dioxygenase subunit alpha [Dietzia sp. UCD-THP]